MNSISIIIPVYNEEKLINNLIDNIKEKDINKDVEIIVVDADKKGSTMNKINDKSVVKLIGKKGRASQMNLGSQYAKNNILFFLHADSMLPEKPFSWIISVLSSSNIKAGAFDLCIDSRNILLKIIEQTASTRSRITRIPYGDQGIFIKKHIFQEIKGYSNIPLMEDIDLMQKLKRKKYKIKILDKKIKTSPRRWEEKGIILCSLRNIIISSMFYLGINAATLRKYY